MTTILVVDDEPANRALIRAYLATSGYILIEADSGAHALELAARAEPDLVLLDVLMPGIDGFEVTRRLKQAYRQSFLPILLVSALTDQDSRHRGLVAGADDFLSKPVDPQELALRVRNLVALREKHHELVERNVEHLELLRFKDEMTSMLVHDLKNPLTGMLLNLDLVCNGELEGVEASEALDDARTGGRRLRELIANLIDTQKLEASRLSLDRKPLDLCPFLERFLAGRGWQARSRDIALTTSCPPGLEVMADLDILTRVVENLVDNALRYTPSGGNILLHAAATGEVVQIRVGNTGPAIPVGARGAIFEKYGQVSVEAGRMNLGLGLYFCRLALEAHGGRIWVEEAPEHPTCFVLELPSASPRAAPAAD